MNTSRRKFLLSSALLISAPFLPEFLTGTALAQDRPRPLPWSGDMVKEFVRCGHVDLDGAKRMLQENPSILNACWDWGGGDYETALGGASHMGRVDIAEYLISQGARMDIYAAAMLGKTDIVTAMLTAYPGITRGTGPHGISLMSHALKGGERAAGVVSLLRSKGISE